MNPTAIIAGIIAAAGVFLIFSALIFPPRVRLEQTRQDPLHQLQERLDAAELPIQAKEFVLICLGITAGTALLGFALGAPVFGLVGLVLAPLLLWQQLESRRDKFHEQYADSLAEVVGLLREGFSATGAMNDALANAAKNGPDPAGADFREILSRKSLGDSLDVAFAPILDRRHEPYLNMVSEALTLKESQGGNAGEVLMGLETMIREQSALRKEIAAKQAQARLEAIIVSLAPIGFFLLLKLLPWMKGYEQGFYNSALGQLVLLVVLVFSVIAYVLSQRLATRGLNLEVQEVTVMVREVRA